MLYVYRLGNSIIVLIKYFLSEPTAGMLVGEAATCKVKSGEQANAAALPLQLQVRSISAPTTAPGSHSSQSA